MKPFCAFLFLEVVHIAITAVHSLNAPGDLGDTYWLLTSINGSFVANETIVQLNTSNVQTLIPPETEKVVFFIHGLQSYKETDWYPYVAYGMLLTYPNWKIIQVDWEQASKNSSYLVTNTYKMGINVAGVITYLNTYGIPGDKIILFGHSLGAHVAGFAGKVSNELNNTISRIISLDAAGPLYEGKSCENRLCKTDCKFLSAIHTDVGGFGYREPLGHADFYPNNGHRQPGCGFIPFIAQECNHGRCWQFMGEGLQFQNHFTSTKCKDYDTFINNRTLCDNITTHLGDMESTEEGVFYLQTNSAPPYSIY